MERQPIMKPALSHPYRILCSLLIVCALFGIGLYRLDINYDVVDSLPKHDPVISDAMVVFKNHPIQDQLVIDVGLQNADLGRLLEYGKVVEQRLKTSGLFRTVGMEDLQKWIPALLPRLLNNLPVLFTEKELHEQIGPTLSDEEIYRRLTEFQVKLMSIEGIGQAAFMQKDPLGWLELVLGRLAALAPSQNARLHKGQLVSNDDKHLLIIASPLLSGTDTQQARKLALLMQQIDRELQQKASGPGETATLTPMGAYRAALDNEFIIKKDVKQAILFATVGIILLLVFAFPRPYLGLLSMLPAIAGTMVAFFAYSLLQRSISVIVLGFGGAIISIAVDHGIAYLLFLDRPQRTFGKEVSREVWSVGLLAVLTTVGAFLALLWSDFPIFEQLGLFSALGVLLSFLFIHLVFPWIFYEMPPARPKQLPLQRLVNRLDATGNKGFYAAALFFIIMLFFARPDFNVDLSAMNTVSRDTLAAEKLITDVWGHAFNRVFVMTTAENLPELQNKGDRLLEIIDTELPPDTFSSGFAASSVFPGEGRQKDNLAAWRRFWTPPRIEHTRQAVTAAAAKLGFKADAFGAFFEILSTDSFPPGESEIPQGFYQLLGLKKNSDGTGWVQVSTFTTTPSYRPEGIATKFQSVGKIFDPAFFSKRLGRLLFATFLKLLIIIAASVVILLLLFFLDLKLTMISLLPIVFAFVASLGTMKLIGHPLDIPGLILAIIVIGMGIDYSLFYVKSYQRYADPLHASFMLVRMAVFMAAASSLIGFGVLCLAEHSILRSAGLTAILGIGYAFIGAVVILPPIFQYLGRAKERPAGRHENLYKGVLRRYRNMEAYPRMFARFKMRLDPMFAELPVLMESTRAIRIIMDIGCGYGVPACWLLERFPEARIYGIDPNPERVRAASLAIGENGAATLGRAPDLPKAPGPADLVTMLDMIHYLDDGDLRLTLQRLRDALAPDGSLMIRAALPPKGRPSLAWRFEDLKNKLAGTACYYRPFDEVATMLAAAGLKIERTAASGSKEDLVWIEVKAGR
ncbi:MAG: MMPL family transporter [Thermodesulfobacteriota bacterium]